MKFDITYEIWSEADKCNGEYSESGYHAQDLTIREAIAELKDQQIRCIVPLMCGGGRIYFEADKFPRSDDAHILLAVHWKGRGELFGKWIESAFVEACY